MHAGRQIASARHVREDRRHIGRAIIPRMNGRRQRRTHGFIGIQCAETGADRFRVFVVRDAQGDERDGVGRRINARLQVGDAFGNRRAIERGFVAEQFRAIVFGEHHREGIVRGNEGGDRDAGHDVVSFCHRVVAIQTSYPIPTTMQSEMRDKVKKPLTADR